MFIGKFDTMDDAYRTIAVSVSTDGEYMLPLSLTGLPTLELRPASFCIADATKALYTGDERKLNHRFLMLEALSFIAGRCDDRVAKMMCAVNPNTKRFVNPATGTFDGAYGPRLANGLHNAYIILSKDIWTRQAVASIWNNVELRDTYDLPCTLTFQFFASTWHMSDGANETRLNLQVNMRSNDINWGMPYDVPAFCEVLVRMAAALGVKPGSYYHNAGSLHLYRGQEPAVADHPWHNKMSEVGQPYERSWYFDSHVGVDRPIKDDEDGWETVMREADRFLDNLWLLYYNDSNKQLRRLGQSLATRNSDWATRTPSWLQRFVSLEEHKR